MEERKNASKTPVIRFRGFEGEWEQRELREISSKIGSGKTPLGGEKAYKDNGVCLIRSQNVKHGTVSFYDAVYIDDETDEDMKNSRVFNGDVMLNITGASIGRSAVYRSFERANVNQHVCIIRPINCESSPEFIHLNLTSINGQKQIFSSQAGGAREGLNFQQISKMLFSFPNSNEQEQIGGFFTNLDNLITLQQQKYDKLKTMKKAMLEKMFPKEGAKVPEVRFAGFTGAWGRRKVLDIAPLQRGMDLPKEEMKKGPFPVVMSNGINGYHSEYRAKGPGVITGRSGTIGNLHYIESDYWPHNTALWVTDFKGNYPRYIYYMYQKLELNRFGTGSGVPTLNRNDVHSEVISLPSFEEQRKIADFFIRFDNTIDLNLQKLNKLKNLKSGLLEKMFV